MEAQSPEPARVRNFSIVSLSGHRCSKSTVTALRDEVCKSAVRGETDVYSKDARLPISPSGIKDNLNSVSKEPVHPVNEEVSFALDTGCHGNSICSFSLALAKGQQHAKGEGEGHQDGHLMVNLISCLGHYAFPNAAAAIRVTDAILMVLDGDEYISPPLFSNTVQIAVREACKPVIFLDRFDEILFTQIESLQPENLYQAYSQTIDATNVIIRECPGGRLDLDLQVDPRQETVLFGSAAAKWGFSITKFADLYAAELGVERDELTKHLWGDYYFDPFNKTWTSKGSSDIQSLQRAFNQFILEPIFKIHSAVVAAAADPRPLTSILARFNIKLTTEDQPKQGRELFNAIMRVWLPIGEALKNVVGRMPSPLEAQRYRTASLYSGPLEDEPGMGMAKCDPEAPLVIYVPHMIPIKASRDKLFLFGRIFSGKISPGQKVRIHGPGRRHGAETALYVKPVGDILTIATGRSNIVKPVIEASAGNLVFLSNLDGFLQRSGTISTSQQTHNIRDMYFCSRPTVQYDIQVKDPEKLPGLVSALNSLCKTELSLESSTTPSGQNSISGPDTSQIEVSLKALRDLSNDPLIVNGPYSTHQETVASESSKIALSKSPNRFNRFYVSAQPLDEDFRFAIEAGIISPLQEFKSRAAMIRRDYAWEEEDARKIWAFGPNCTGPNIVVDQTKATSFLSDIRDSFVSGFQWASHEGPLAGEPMCGVRFNIMDVTLFSDAIHRGAGQIIPTARRVTFASMLLSKPRLMELNCLVQVQTSEEHVAEVRKTIEQGGGALCDTDFQCRNLSSNIWRNPVIQAYMSNMATVRLETVLQQNVELSQHVSVQSVKAGWQEVGNGDPLDETSEAGNILLTLRKRKGLSPTIDINNYLDKL
ncbi:translation elongation factor 2 [Conoideocrella luteorostrata]|uniref:Translation elongation factor 2 n=1 Tax=Conoideocrella luteorostrata TaxID=1105319 RepID=A0AAJ0G2K7_9HYPO|nr:translation elongation factor 2 [Conoideocrella luteorostrata]